MNLCNIDESDSILELDESTAQQVVNLDNTNAFDLVDDVVDQDTQKREDDTQADKPDVKQQILRQDVCVLGAATKRYIRQHNDEDRREKQPPKAIIPGIVDEVPDPTPYHHPPKDRDKEPCEPTTPSSIRWVKQGKGDREQDKGDQV